MYVYMNDDFLLSIDRSLALVRTNNRYDSETREREGEEEEEGEIRSLVFFF